MIPPLAVFILQPELSIYFSITSRSPNESSKYCPLERQSHTPKQVIHSFQSQSCSQHQEETLGDVKQRLGVCHEAFCVQRWEPNNSFVAAQRKSLGTSSHGERPLSNIALKRERDEAWAPHLPWGHRSLPALLPLPGEMSNPCCLVRSLLQVTEPFSDC